MKTLNVVYLIGSAGRDPEIRSTADGTCIAGLSIATSHRFKDKAGNWQEAPEWHALTAFGRIAEVMRDYVRKGSPLHIEGRIQTRSWDKDGVKQYRTEIVVENLILLGSGEKKERKATTPSYSPFEKQDAIDEDSIPF